MTRTAPSPSPSASSEVVRRTSGRRRAPLALALAVLTVAAAVVVYMRFGPPSDSTCSFGQAGSYTLAAQQADEASIIAAVAERLGLPDHAVTVALATSLQESKLRNLSYGDKDSVGLFQQRPSEGWGTRAEILDPVYAATAFYRRLVQVPGWQTMPVTDAAQMVQHSDAPLAYGQWATEARTLARALTGEVPAGLSCTVRSYHAGAPTAAALDTAEKTDLGQPGFGVPVSAKRGWELATWAVAHAYDDHVRAVSFAGRTWTSGVGWHRAASAAPDVVTVRSAGP